MRFGLWGTLAAVIAIIGSFMFTGWLSMVCAGASGILGALLLVDMVLAVRGRRW